MRVVLMSGDHVHVRSIQNPEKNPHFPNSLESFQHRNDVLGDVFGIPADFRGFCIPRVESAKVYQEH